MCSSSVYLSSLFHRDIFIGFLHFTEPQPQSYCSPAGLGMPPLSTKSQTRLSPPRPFSFLASTLLWTCGYPSLNLHCTTHSQYHKQYWFCNVSSIPKVLRLDFAVCVFPFSQSVSIQSTDVLRKYQINDYTGITAHIKYISFGHVEIWVWRICGLKLAPNWGKKHKNG